jgi:hypothetical protein
MSKTVQLYRRYFAEILEILESAEHRHLLTELLAQVKPFSISGEIQLDALTEQYLKWLKTNRRSLYRTIKIKLISQTARRAFVDAIDTLAYKPRLNELLKKYGF